MILLLKARFCDFSHRGYGNGFFEIGWWTYMTIASKPHIPFLWRIFLRLGSSSLCSSIKLINWGFQLVLFNTDQKMALIVFYFINVYRTCGHTVLVNKFQKTSHPMPISCFFQFVKTFKMLLLKYLLISIKIVKWMISVEKTFYHKAYKGVMLGTILWHVW